MADKLRMTDKNVSCDSSRLICRKMGIDSVFVTPFVITGEIYINSHDILGCSDVEITIFVNGNDLVKKNISGKELKPL